jgi:G3E family GTPase
MSVFASHASDGRLPVIVLTGFLGSGKTTLLNGLLKHPDMSSTAVVINEIGEVGLDQHFIDESDTDVVMLANGCLCCRVLDDLQDTIANLYARRTQGQLPAFERLIIETTGLADPGPVLEGFLSNPMLRRCFHVAGVVTTLDVVHSAGQLDEFYEAVRQVAVADTLVLTKQDIGDRQAASVLADRLRTLNPGAQIVDVDDAIRDPRRLFDSVLVERAGAWRVKAGGEFVPAMKAAMDHGRGRPHDARVAAFAVTVDEPVDWGVFSDWLRRLRIENGDRLLRIKGILNVRGEHDPIAVHGVHHVLHPPTALREWPWEDHRSRLVFITTDLSRDVIVSSLEEALQRGEVLAEASLPRAVADDLQLR